MAKSKKYKFIVRLASERRAAAIRKFHKAHVGKFLWPRTLKEIRKMIEDECLYELVEQCQVGIKLIGICYIAQGEHPELKTSRREFGGIFILKKYRGSKFGLAKVLGTAAISEHFIWDSSGDPMIAHVHEENDLPRRFLAEDMGFKLIGKETPPRNKVPKNMKTNDEGDVVGDLFEFQREKLADFADWLSMFKGKIKATETSALKLDLAIGKRRIEAVKALRKLASRI